MDENELAGLDAQLKAFAENVQDTLDQTQGMRDSIMMIVPTELRMAALLEHQVILGELQQAREHLLSSLTNITTIRNALAQERATKEYEKARQSSDALARSQTGLQRALDRARDSMERGAAMGPVTDLVKLIVQAITEQGALTVLLAQTSQDKVIRAQAEKVEDGLKQIETKSRKQQLKILLGNRAKYQEQAAQYGGMGQAPVWLQNQFEENEREIETLKQ